MNNNYPNFSPAFLSSLIIAPLRYMFMRYVADDLKWSKDVTKSNIEIDTINNFNKIKIQQKPRILVGRGQYGISPVGLSDNLAEGVDLKSGFGLKNDMNMVIIDGVCQILIEARNEGTCEKIVDHVTHFLVWAGPLLCNTQGFKSFGLPLPVSPCTPSREDTETFTCTINIPWRKEEMWRVETDGILIKDMLITLD